MPIKLPEYLNHGEIDSLISNAPSDDARTVLVAMWRAGLRVTEAISLQWRDVNLDENYPTIRVRNPKGGEEREVPLHPELREVLRAAAQKRPEGQLVPITRQRAWQWVKQALKQSQQSGDIALGKHVGTHTLRHSAARHWLMHGTAINVVQLWLGHKDISFTQPYVKLIPQALGNMRNIP